MAFRRTARRTVNEVIIGVDWKSLTIPACLPITTDYFPDKRALQTDYVVSLYNLLPDDVNAESQQKATYKKPLTTIEVFEELISQRLAQGFQLIVLPSAKECANTSLLRKSISDGELTYSLSIGRLFHKITLTGNAITVTRYRPRHPYPGFNYQYRYRFHTPHHDTYEESYASFSTEKLEHYNWNYLDHYICTRGDTDFSLVGSLKYWRFRVYLLPLNNAATKRIVEGSHCDIYGSMTSSDHQQMVEGFLKFVETVVNRIKRPSAKKPRMSLGVINHNTPLVQPRRNSMSAVNQSSTSSNSPFRERLGSNRLPDRPRPRSGSKVLERGRASPAIEILQQQLTDSQAQDNGIDDNVICDPLLRANAAYAEILEAMKQPINGLGLLTTHQSLPQYTFISSDAVNWLISHMEGVSTVEQALKIFVAMQKESLICHASGDTSKPFIQGFFLYYIVQQARPEDRDRQSQWQSLDIAGFQNDWMEVEIKEALNAGSSHSPSSPTNGSTDPEEGVPRFLRDEIVYSCLQMENEFSENAFTRMHLDIDVTNKSDRVEWGHVRYQTLFRPDQAYELVAEWLIASGSIVAELLHGWARKVQGCGLQMVPIPHDPLALPYLDKSDPLRGPIFIPLNLSCLEPYNTLFKGFREDTCTERLFLLQEAIICRFGFIPCLTEAPNKESLSQEYQYIHCTGTVFILISSPISKSRNKYLTDRRQLGSKYSHHADVVPSPHEAYITRHVSGKNKDDYDKSKKMGFLWSWNHMISRRWRTNQVDYNFQIKLLKDFREFCMNTDNRLKMFWNECWEIKTNINTKTHFSSDN